MVRANDDNTDSPEATSDTNKKKREPGRLTPMPDWLMHWWTPLLLAGILLAAGCFLASIWRMPLRPVSWWKINLYWPPSWPFIYHWPSKDAMALCATIAGAGFAFSAWQQRSHDTAARELERATESLWHMRNTAHKLLSANSYYDQYEGICRYFELADQLNKSIQIESNTRRILNSGILSALCAHIRYLGDPLPNNFENENERGELQNLILNNILERINTNLKGYWDGLTVNLTNTTFLTAVTIVNFTSKSKIYLTKSRFEYEVNIDITDSSTFYWKNCSFLSNLKMTGKTTDPKHQLPLLLHDNFPSEVKHWHFENIALCVLEDLQHEIAPGRPLPNQGFPSFQNCNFLRPKATQQHPTDVSADADTDSFDETETPAPPDHYIWATISFNFDLLDKQVDTTLYFTKCIFGTLSTLNTWHLSQTYFTRCKITQDNETHANNIAPEHFKFTDCSYFGPSDH